MLDSTSYCYVVCSKWCDFSCPVCKIRWTLTNWYKEKHAEMGSCSTLHFTFFVCFCELPWCCSEVVQHYQIPDFRVVLFVGRPHFLQFPLESRRVIWKGLFFIKVCWSRVFIWYPVPRGGWESLCFGWRCSWSVRNHKTGEVIALQFLHEYALSLSPLLAHICSSCLSALVFYNWYLENSGEDFDVAHISIGTVTFAVSAW